MPELPKVYLVDLGPFGFGDIRTAAITEDGECLGEHICSSRKFMVHDLHEFPQRRVAFTEKFGGYGDGEHYTLIVAGWDDLPAELTGGWLAKWEAGRAANGEVTDASA